MTYERALTCWSNTQGNKTLFYDARVLDVEDNTCTCMHAFSCSRISNISDNFHKDCVRRSHSQGLPKIGKWADWDTAKLPVSNHESKMARKVTPWRDVTYELERSRYSDF